ncbi:hypothetical protein [Clostridium lacusfryxellense]|uniref:hypothetical protein n=1 Tax=Clostridium lacusfryxellense TaxID=205328 RepID=UPI001C0CCB0F|nr:hypothetical protein [Clostridium lacusfryxellense]MBU3112330.1 hypothetical protein [Clostridium lacusfryxellense]
MKKILVATGTSQHKLEAAVNYIKEYCEKKAIDVDVEGANVYTANIEAINPDVIVLIGPNNIKLDIPVVSGLAFVTQMGMDATCDKVINALNL